MYESIVKFVFEKLPIIKWFDGYKTMIGEIALQLTAILVVVQGYFPEAAWIAPAVAVLGVVAKLCGVAHAKVKAKQ